MNPEQYALRNTAWQFFATLTFKREEMSASRRLKLFFAFGRRVAGWFKVYFPRLKWALRLEHGEKNGRLHFHVLIAGLPENAAQSVTCHSMEKLWEHSMRVGIAKVRVWERGRDAVSYILKDDPGYSLRTANQYECAKFGSSRCMVKLSESILSALGGRREWAMKAGEGRIMNHARNS